VRTADVRSVIPRVHGPQGEGVNQAMYDALVLFECIAAELGGSGGDKTEGGYSEEADAAALERAVAAYEAEMRPRARDYIQRCIAMEGMLYADDAAQCMVDMVNEAMKQAGDAPKES
jgi:2-polyprenyl-6-methoxyphenol hydroxylase-like FAD-dependent oxidoreductase